MEGPSHVRNANGLVLKLTAEGRRALLPDGREMPLAMAKSLFGGAPWSRFERGRFVPDALPPVSRAAELLLKGNPDLLLAAAGGAAPAPRKRGAAAMAARDADAIVRSVLGDADPQQKPLQDPAAMVDFLRPTPMADTPAAPPHRGGSWAEYMRRGERFSEFDAMGEPALVAVQRRFRDPFTGRVLADVALQLGDAPACAVQGLDDATLGMNPVFRDQLDAVALEPPDAVALEP